VALFPADIWICGKNTSETAVSSETGVGCRLISARSPLPRATIWRIRDTFCASKIQHATIALSWLDMSLCWARTLPTASALKRMSTHDKGRQRPSPPRGANISRTPSAFGLGPHIFHRKFLALSYGVRGLVGRNFISSQPACRGRT
jgi:hypothetical protein